MMNRHITTSCNSYLSIAKLLTYVRALFLFPGIALLLVVTAGAAPDVPGTDKEEWKYYHRPEKPAGRWNQQQFDDSGWERRPAGIGYGNRHAGKGLRNMKGKYKRVYARRAFHINDPDKIRELKISVVCDGPFAAYIDGMRVIRNIVGLSSPDPAGGPPIGQDLDISGWAHELSPGLNVLTIHCDNDDIDSDDFLFIPSLKISEDVDAK